MSMDSNRNAALEMRVKKLEADVQRLVQRERQLTEWLISVSEDLRTLDARARKAY